MSNTSPSTKPVHECGSSADIFRAKEREARVRAKTTGSRERFERASASLAGGVSSGLRRSARPYPLYYDRGDAATVVDVDGNAYSDYTLAWGPLILGHAPEVVAGSMREQVGRGLTFGAQHDLEIEVAEQLVKVIPCADLVCFANSGTEIVQVALRLARAATGRQKYLKFEGHYHGWSDNVLLSYHPAESDLARSNGDPVGVGEGQLADGAAVIAHWNSRESVEEAFQTHGHEISAVICEPILCNSGCIEPEPGFLAFLREITSAHGALLIFDEVITGFRVALGGAQEWYGVVPDLATYAKAVGAGTPLSVLAGKREYMNLIAGGRVVHAGTLNGNPLCLAAAKAALEYLSAESASKYAELHSKGDRLCSGLSRLLRAKGLPVVTSGFGPVFHIAFTNEQPRTYRDTLKNDSRMYSDFALALLDEGVLVLPDGRWYVSFAHTDSDIDATLAAAERAVS